MSNTEALREAAQAVLDRWDSPQWEWIRQGPTADLMHALRNALAQPAADIDEAQIARLHERGAVAWAGVDAADLRAGGDGMPAQSGEHLSGKWEGAEEWMPLAWELCADECGEEACTELVWEGGPVPEPWGDRWLKYEYEAKRLIALVRKHVPAAQPAPALVPPGWVLVPVEPTPEMLAVNVDPGEYVSIEAARILWRAMLAAAPDAQKGAA